MYGQCECPKGYYKTKGNECESLEDVDLEGMLSEDALDAASIEDLVVTSQIAKSSGSSAGQNLIVFLIILFFNFF